MADSPCGLFPFEVFIDSANGTYLGDFPYDPAAFGWIPCMATCDPMSFFACFRSFYKGYICECLKTFKGIHVPFAFGVGAAGVTDDASGPPGLEAVPALDILLPGAPDCYVGWAGANPTISGEIITTSDPPWWPAAGETWIFSCWARIIGGSPDPDNPAKLSFAVAPNGFAPGNPTTDSLELTDDWQFYMTTFTGEFFPASTFAWPLIQFHGGIENQGADHCDFFGTRIDLTTYQPAGTVLIKCPHLYRPGPMPGGNWIDSFHGHG